MSADLASDAKADPAAVESELAAVTHATRRAGELVRQLLVFANPRTPAAQLAPALDVNAYLASSAHMLRRLMGDRVALDIVAAEREAWILMDPSQFEQVVMNLVVNARDAMPTGGVIRVETAMVELTTPSSPRRATRARGSAWRRYTASCTARGATWPCTARSDAGRDSTSTCR